MKKRMLSVLSLALALVMLVGCGQKSNDTPPDSSKPSQSESTEQKEEGKKKDPSELNFTFVAPMLGNDYWEGVIRGVEDKAAELGVNMNVVAPGSNFDLTACCDLLEATIAGGSDGIIMGAYDADAVKPGFQKAADAGIPVVCVDCDSPDSARLAYAGTSNYDAGYFAGKTMAEVTGGKANIAFMTGSLTGDSAVSRMNGFMDAIKDYPEMKVLTKENTESDALIAVQKAEAILNAYPECNACFGVQVFDGPGMGQVVAERGIEDFTIIGFDDVATMMQYIREGVCYGTLIQNTHKMGELGVEMLLKLAQGETLEETVIDTGVTLVTAENIDALGY